MPNKKSILVIRIVAFVIIIVALFSLPGLIKVIDLELSFLLQSEVRPGIYDLNLLWTIWFVILFIIKLISAYGLFRIRPWAWTLAIGVLTVDFLSRLYTISSIPSEPVTLNHSEGIIIESFSLWPIYIHAIIPFVLIIILLQKPMRKVLAQY